MKGDLSQLPISMIFQESKYSLNPVRKVDFHLLEVIERYRHCSQDEAYDLMLSELAAVGIQAPDRIVQRHPFELTVEERQRIMLFLALLKRPKLLIADEPTTGLDVTIQKEILNLIVDKQAELDLSVVLVTHDLGVVAEICDEIKVMYDGLIVEEGGVEAIFYEPVHRYTQELIKAIPRGINGQHLYTMEKQFLTADEKAGRLAPLDDRDISPVHRVLKGASEL